MTKWYSFILYCLSLLFTLLLNLLHLLTLRKAMKNLVSYILIVRFSSIMCVLIKQLLNKFKKDANNMFSFEICWIIYHIKTWLETTLMSCTFRMAKGEYKLDSLLLWNNIVLLAIKNRGDFHLIGKRLLERLNALFITA